MLETEAGSNSTEVEQVPVMENNAYAAINNAEGQYGHNDWDI